MTERDPSPDRSAVGTSKWLRLSRILLLIGVTLIVGTAMINVLIGTVSAFTGISLIPISHAEILAAPLIFGMLLIVAGIIAWIVPHASTGDWLWIAKTGPFIR